MLEIRYFSKFKKDYKIIKKRGYNLENLKKVIDILAQEKNLPLKYRDHQLSGIYCAYRECHIEPDWLLIYKIEQKTLILTLIRTGTHSDLF